MTPKLEMPIHVIFDLDGTVLDNAEYSKQSVFYAFEQTLGIELTEAEFKSIQHKRFSESIPQMLKLRELLILEDPTILVNRFLQCKRGFCAKPENLKLVELAYGAREALEFLKSNNVLTAAASNGYLPALRVILQNHNIDGLFNVLYAANVKNYQKPSQRPLMIAQGRLKEMSKYNYREFVESPSLMIGDTPANDGIAVQNLREFRKRQGLELNMEFGLVDLKDTDSHNIRDDCDFYLGGDLKNLINLL